MDRFIVTGASRGLGAALVREVLSLGTAARIDAVSRGTNEELLQAARGTGTRLRWWSLDLSRCADQADGLLLRLAELVDDGSELSGAEEFDRVILINNAGLVEPLGPVGTTREEDIDRLFRVDLVAPALLSSLFLRRYDGSGGAAPERWIINITSGAAGRNVPGAAYYCAAKAGLDRLTMATAAEQQTRRYPARILAISPGMVDTAMQESMRTAPEERLPTRGFYRDAFERGELIDAGTAAKTILSLLERPGISNGAVLHARDLQGDSAP